LLSVLTIEGKLTIFSQRSLLLRGMVRSSCGHSRIAACISMYLALDPIISFRCCVHLVNETEAYRATIADRILNVNARLYGTYYTVSTCREVKSNARESKIT
jgi:hypothetical protein